MHKEFPVILSTVFVSALLFTGCGENYTPLKASQCSTIVQHSAKILGKFAKPRAEMMKACKDSTDLQRGCALQAKIVADLSKCAKL